MDGAYVEWCIDGTPFHGEDFVSGSLCDEIDEGDDAFCENVAITVENLLTEEGLELPPDWEERLRFSIVRILRDRFEYGPDDLADLWRD